MPAPVAERLDLIPIRADDDVVRVRQQVRARAVELGMRLIDQTKIVTAASELARNTLEYGGGGTARIERISEQGLEGLRLIFEDQGPGIPDIARAMTDGYTTGRGLGLGLSGAKRLSNLFDIWSEPGRGTRVTITRWK